MNTTGKCSYNDKKEDFKITLFMCRLEVEMVDISVGCVNENTYGISCDHCGKCGRKFTLQGIDDSEVIPKKIKEYSDFLESDLWKEIEINIK